MRYSKVLLASVFLLMMSSNGPVSWAQDEIELEGGEEMSADDANFEDTGEEISFDEFAEEEPSDTKKADSTPSEDPAPSEEPVPTEEEPPSDMVLEPLDGTEDQVTDIPAEAPTEPTPEEMTPPAPQPVVEEAPTEPTPAPLMDDEPDLALEAKLYDIYLNYHSKKLSEEEWSQLVASRESEIYRIQPGDTLWGISKTFFNDGNYWPKIWQLNSGITNPHLIQPGNSIRFLLGTESDTPAFAVAEGTEVQLELNDVPVELPVGDAGAAGIEQQKQAKNNTTNGAEGSAMPTDGVEIPPPGEEYKPVLTRVPPSLPEWTHQRRGKEYDDSGIDYGRRKILDLPDKKFLESFIDEKDYKGDGEIKEIEGRGNTASNFQYVFVSLPPGKGKKGDPYTVIRPAGRLARVNQEVAVTNKDMGYLYHVLGELKLEEMLTQANGRDIYRAMVVKTITQIEKGSMVSAGPMPEISVNSNGDKSDISAQIIGASQLENQKTLALMNIAYLKGGEADGLAEGQVLTVRANTRVRNADSIVKEAYIPIGLLRVVRVGKRFSTAIVTKVWDAILVGDVTGAGKVLPPETPERMKQAKSGKSAKASAPSSSPTDDSEIDPDLEKELEPDSGDEFDEFEDVEIE